MNRVYGQSFIIAIKGIPEALDRIESENERITRDTVVLVVDELRTQMKTRGVVIPAPLIMQILNQVMETRVTACLTTLSTQAKRRQRLRGKDRSCLVAYNAFQAAEGAIESNQKQKIVKPSKEINRHGPVARK